MDCNSKRVIPLILRILSAASMAVWVLAPAFTKLYLAAHLLPSVRQAMEQSLMLFAGPLWLLIGLGMWIAAVVATDRSSMRLLVIPGVAAISVALAATTSLTPSSWGLDRAIMLAFERTDLSRCPSTLHDNNDRDFRPGVFIREDQRSTLDEALIPLRGVELIPLTRVPSIIRHHELDRVRLPLHARPVKDGWWFVYQE